MISLIMVVKGTSFSSFLSSLKAVKTLANLEIMLHFYLTSWDIVQNNEGEYISDGLKID